ncbi:MAG: glycosyltransferase family 2 protein [Nitrospinae bacterium]|nr:glycosyltransferase family 2 protein [Nitrospinota bacterium]
MTPGARNNNPLISVVIPNWNGKKFLPACLDSLKRQSYPNLDVIVVDNGSTDGSVQYLKENYPGFVKIVELQENHGFDRAVNEGIKVSKGAYIATLNNDTETHEDWIRELAKGFDHGDRVGMCASKILFYFNRDIIDKTGHVMYLDGLNKGRGAMQKDNGKFEVCEEVFFPDGCAALYKRELFDEVGLFDERFFAYGDDAELGFRARLFGWKCVYMPSAVVYHIHSGTTSPYSKLKVFLVERNRFWLALKLFPLPFLLATPFYTALRFYWHSYSAFFQKGSAGRFRKEFSSVELVLVLMKSYLSGLKGLPYILGKRREILRKKAVNNRQIKEWFSRFGISAKDIALID